MRDTTEIFTCAVLGRHIGYAARETSGVCCKRDIECVLPERHSLYAGRHLMYAAREALYATHVCQ